MLIGNMLSDGNWTYTWDGENRLTWMVSTNLTKTLSFEYDWQGRRTAKKVWNNTTGSGTPATYLKYIYDGWNLIAELNAKNSNAVVRTYSWGSEVQGAPGTLRMIADNNGVYFPAYDPNGNVMGLVKASDGTVCAQYEYLPYGEQVTATGTIAVSNPIRFSTKYYDTEARLYYYGYRYYSSDMGRWLSRDPIEEQGGLNLYGFVNNDPVNKWDRLGMSYKCSKLEEKKEQYKKLTESEKKWIKKHLCCAFSARNSKENIIKEVVRRYSGGPENTVVNAIQHCAWMCYVASMFLCSKDDALALGRAHEDWGDNPEHDMAMDLFNNAVGVSVGGTDLKSCFDKCEAKAKSYELYWWKPLGSGVDKKNLPSDFPGFTLSPDGRIIGGNIGDSSPTSPSFTIPIK